MDIGVGGGIQTIGRLGVSEIGRGEYGGPIFGRSFS